MRLGIDFGTSTTVAVLAGPDGRNRPLLFDSSPLLVSSVFVAPDGSVLTGADAERAALAAPDGLEPNPKRRIDDGEVWLAEREHPVVDLIGAVLTRVVTEARRVADDAAIDTVVLTHPAAWGTARIAALAEAAGRAGLRDVVFVPEPVAAGIYYADVLGHVVRDDRCLVVYDLGAGTFDVSVIRPAGDTFEVVASAGLDDVGGLDLDAAIVGHARQLTKGSAAAWARLDAPQTPADRQARQSLWRGARAAKELLSRHPTADLHVPLVDADVHLTREEFDRLALPSLDRTARLTARLLAETGIPPEALATVFLVGGASRTPLASTLLHRTLGVAPTALDHPELVVAEGSVHAPAVTTTARSAPEAADAPGSPAVVVPPKRRSLRSLVAVGAVLVLVAAAVTLAVLRPWADAPIRGARLAAELTGHSHGLTAVAFSPDGKYLAAGGGDYTQIRLWDVAGRTPLPDLFVGHGGGVISVAFSPDGKRLASTAYDGTVRLWNVQTRKEVGAPLASATGVAFDAVAFSPDSKLVAAGGSDEAVRLWNVDTGQPVGQPLTGHGSEVTAVAFAPNGKTLVSGDHEGKVRRWNPNTGAPIGEPIEANGSWISGIAFSPDGRLMATAGRDHTARLFNAGTGAPIGDQLTGHTDDIDAIAFSRDGSALATASADHTVRLWSAATRRPIGEPLAHHTGEVTTVAFSPDGETLASGGSDTTILLWTLLR